jgi:hypothetical protein
MDGWMNELMDIWMDGWMVDGWCLPVCLRAIVCASLRIGMRLMSERAVVTGEAPYFVYGLVSILH